MISATIGRVTCPACGTPADPGARRDLDTKQRFVSCAGCLAVFLAAPASRLVVAGAVVARLRELAERQEGNLVQALAEVPDGDRILALRTPEVLGALRTARLGRPAHVLVGRNAFPKLRVHVSGFEGFRAVGDLLVGGDTREGWVGFRPATQFDVAGVFRGSLRLRPPPVDGIPGWDAVKELIADPDLLLP
jgi:hypothetical protein